MKKLSEAMLKALKAAAGHPVVRTPGVWLAKPLPPVVRLCTVRALSRRGLMVKAQPEGFYMDTDGYRITDAGKALLASLEAPKAAAPKRGPRVHYGSQASVACNYSGQARTTHRWLKSEKREEVTCARCLKIMGPGSKAPKAAPEAVSVSYEWALEEDGDADFAQALEGAGAFWSQALKTGARLALVRSVGEPVEGLAHREWAYVEGGELPQAFSAGATIPARYRAELAAWGVGKGHLASLETPEPTPEPSAVERAAAAFPAVFGLKGYAGRYVINLRESYEDGDVVVLYVFTEAGDDFLKGTPDDLRGHVVELEPEPTAPKGGAEEPDPGVWPAEPCAEWVAGWNLWVSYEEEPAAGEARWGWRAAAFENEMGGLRPTRWEVEPSEPEPTPEPPAPKGGAKAEDGIEEGAQRAKGVWADIDRAALQEQARALALDEAAGHGEALKGGAQ